MITDLEYLKTMAGDDPVFIREMIDIFKVQVEEFAASMPQLYENAQFEALSKEAHKAKSSVAIMGMTREADMLKMLEMLAKEGKEPESYEEIIHKFIDQSRKAVKELDTLYK